MSTILRGKSTIIANFVSEASVLEEERRNERQERRIDGRDSKRISLSASRGGGPISSSKRERPGSGSVHGQSEVCPPEHEAVYYMGSPRKMSSPQTMGKVPSSPKQAKATKPRAGSGSAQPQYRSPSPRTRHSPSLPGSLPAYTQGPMPISTSSNDLSLKFPTNDIIAMPAADIPKINFQQQQLQLQQQARQVKQINASHRLGHLQEGEYDHSSAIPGKRTARKMQEEASPYRHYDDSAQSGSVVNVGYRDMASMGRVEDASEHHFCVANNSVTPYRQHRQHLGNPNTYHQDRNCVHAKEKSRIGAYGHHNNSINRHDGRREQLLSRSETTEESESFAYTNTDDSGSSSAFEIQSDDRNEYAKSNERNHQYAKFGSEDEEVYIVKQRYGYCSIAFSTAQVIILATMMLQCGIAPLDINPMFGPYPDALSEWGGKNSIKILEDNEYWRLLTPTFLHAGIIHLLCNVAVQIELGIFFEREWGSIAWVIIYLSSSVSASILSVIFMPNAISVGSSGAVMGLFGGKLAEVFCRFCERSETSQERVGHQVRKEQCAGVMCSVTVVMAFSFIPYVDWAAHLGGLCGGVTIGMVIFSLDIQHWFFRSFWFIIGGILTIGSFSLAFNFMYYGGIEVDEDLRDVCGYYQQYFDDYECICMRGEHEE